MVGIDNNQIQDEITTLDSIAENLNNAYPVGKSEFENGFKINNNLDKQSDSE